MAGLAGALWELAYDLYAHESLGEDGVLDRVFAALQQRQIIRVRVEVVSLDSTVIKVHPDGTGARKKTGRKPREVSRRLDDQDSSGCRGCVHCRAVFAVAGPSWRCA